LSPAVAPDANYEGAIYNANFEGYRVLVYDGGGSQAGIQQAMPQLGITDFDLRTSGNPVTLTDLTTHDILVVGWNADGNMSGLDPAILTSGITGRILLTGHDADWHTVNGPEAGKTFLAQAIAYVLAVSHTGMVALGDYSTAFSYLPDEWGISATGGLVSETITSFTTEGLDSGVFDGLTPEDMSNWGNSYHARFTAWGAEFVSFELGGAGEDVITIATTGVTLEKVDDVNDGDCVRPGEDINYTICYSYHGDANCPDINDVNIIDYLPPEVQYVSSQPEPNEILDCNTIIWEIGTLKPGDANCIMLKVRVKCPQLGVCPSNSFKQHFFLSS
jgi:hypothetical protein